MIYNNCVDDANDDVILWTFNHCFAATFRLIWTQLLDLPLAEENIELIKLGW